MVSIPADFPVLMGFDNKSDSPSLTVGLLTRRHQLTQRTDTESRDSDTGPLNAGCAAKEKQECRHILESPIPFEKGRPVLTRREESVQYRCRTEFQTGSMKLERTQT